MSDPFEDRLRERLRQAAARMDPPPSLWSKVEGRAAAGPGRQVPPRLAAALVAVVAMAGVVAVVARSGPEGARGRSVVVGAPAASGETSNEGGPGPVEGGEVITDAPEPAQDPDVPVALTPSSSAPLRQVPLPPPPSTAGPSTTFAPPASSPSAAPPRPPVQEPPTPQPWPPPTTVPAGQRYPVGWDRYTVSPDGRTLTLTYTSGVEPCAVFDSIRADESASQVVVTIYERNDAGPDTACIMLAKEKTAQVTLEAPLGDRRVVDGAPG